MKYVSFLFWFRSVLVFRLIRPKGFQDDRAKGFFVRVCCFVERYCQKDVTKDSPCDDSIKGVVLAHEKSEESDYRQGIIKVDSLGCF